MDIFKTIKSVITIFESKDNDKSLEDILKSYGLTTDLFFSNLFINIIKELSILENTIINDDINNYNSTSLYLLINAFCNKKYNQFIDEEPLNNIVTKSDIISIFKKIININKTIINYENNSQFTKNFNNNITNFLNELLELDSKYIIELLIKENNSEISLSDIFNIFSSEENHRKYLFNLEKYFFYYYPQENSYKEYLNIIINNLKKNINDNKNILSEIIIIITLCKDNIDVIKENMNQILMIIFENYEKSEENNLKESLKAVFQKCFNLMFSEIGNNKEKKSNIKLLNFFINLYKNLCKKKLIKSINLFFIYLSDSFTFSKISDEVFEWILNKTIFFNSIYNPLIELKDNNLILFYLNHVFTLFSSKGNNYNKNISHKYLIFIISNFHNIIDEVNDDKINLEFYKVMKNIILFLIKNDLEAFDIALYKYRLVDVILLMLNSDGFNHELKIKLIQFLEEIIKINKNKYNNQYKITINIPNNMNDINQRLMLLSLLNENDIISLEKQISNINIDIFKALEENNFQTFIYYYETLHEYINNKNTKILNINTEISSKLNDIYIKVFEKINKNELHIENISLIDIQKKLINNLINSIFNFNMKSFYNKFNNNEINHNKFIFSEKTIYEIFKNIFSSSFKNELLSFILFELCLYKNKILKSPRLIYIVFYILSENKDIESLYLFLDNLEQILNYNCINNKMIINFDFIPTLLNLTISIDNEKKLLEKIKIFLSKLAPYLDQKSLNNYIEYINNILYDAFIYESNDMIKNKKLEIANELFGILNNGIFDQKKINNNYISISNQLIPNPFIYNLFYITGIKEVDKIIQLDMDIRIYNSDIKSFNLTGFKLAKFFFYDKLSYLTFKFDEKNQLLISQKILKYNEVVIKTIKNIDNYFTKDKNFHRISIILNSITFSIQIFVDSEEIKDDGNKIPLNKYFSFDNSEVLIGYENNFEVINNKNYENNDSIVDISNIILLNYNIDDINILNYLKKELDFNDTNNSMDEYAIEKNENMSRIIIAKFNFKNKINLDFINLNKIKNSDIQIGYEFLNKNKYIGKINFDNLFSYKEVKKNVNIYFISYNYNIEKFISLNDIISENDINKNIIKNYISTNYDSSLSILNYSFIDFIIGFLYIFDKKRKLELKNNNTNNENNIKNNNDFIFEFTSKIIILILTLENKFILNYFLYENDIINIKLKVFFERNIFIINNKLFIEKLLSLDTTKNFSEENLLYFITKIFLNINIFKNINNEIRKILLLKILEIADKKLINFELDNIKLFYEFLMSIYNIILFCEISTEYIDEENNKTQLDILLKLILKINSIFKDDYDYLILENNITYY